jgi:hypothetical protein
MRLSKCSTALALSLLAACTLAAQQTNDERREFAVTFGEISGGNPNASTPLAPAALSLNAGIAIEANFAQKIRDVPWGAIYWEVDGVGAPLRYVAGTPGAASHEMHSVYAMPGLKMQFTPKEPLSPWIAAGGGYAFYDASGTAIQGGPTGGGASSSGGTKNTYAVDFGGGIDYAMGKRYVLRGTVRGIYTGNPNFGVPTSGGLWNFVISGGIVWRSSK